MYLVNMTEGDFFKQKNKFLGKIKEYVDKNCPGESIIPYSADFESKLAELETEDERKAYIADRKVKTQLPKVKQLSVCKFLVKRPPPDGSPRAQALRKR
jgi:obg-like ATPase 1